MEVVGDTNGTVQDAKTGEHENFLRFFVDYLIKSQLYYLLIGEIKSQMEMRMTKNWEQ